VATPVPHPLNGARARHLVLALAALLGLAALSWWLAHLELGAFATPVALGIAAAKALLVALVFMELSGKNLAIRFAAVLVPLFVVLLAGLVFTDVTLR
jgi:cytochrome c oxidase subunit 4